MHILGRILLLGWLLAGAAHALYLEQGVTAYRVPDNKIAVDGRPDTVWWEISAKADGMAPIAFDDYGRIVLLEPTAVRNAPPDLHYSAPAYGSVTLLAAYDTKALYFFALVRENSAFNPTLCSTAELWKANALEIYVDPNVWDTTLYTAYFSADAGERSNGTSPKSLQVAKAAWPTDTRRYFRDRTVGNRFELRTPTSELKAVASARHPSDPNTVGVEFRIPFPNAADYAAGKAMFISWGYNHFPQTYRTACDSNPIAYRWAKHYKTYGAGSQKPPGWQAGDSTHFDPLRSYDGWARFELRDESAGFRSCHGYADTLWDMGQWEMACTPIATGLAPAPAPKAPPRATSGAWFEALGRRDLRGRHAFREAVGIFLLPDARRMRRYLGKP